MSLKERCRKTQEQLPLLLNGTLTEHAAAEVRRHVGTCPACRSAFEKESHLFRLALESGPHNPIQEHPEPDVLDGYARAPDRLSSPLRIEVEAHLAQCDICRSLIERLGVLPESLDDLAAPGEVPLISQLDGDVGSAAISRERTNVTWLRFWRPAAAIAAAASVVVAAISLLQLDQETPIARVEARFPAVVRANGPKLVFESASRSFLLDAVVYVGPEEHHTYSVRIHSAEENRPVYREDEVPEYDKDGFFRFVTPMEVGAYRLLIFDVVDNDTLVVRRPFEVVLQK